jgi:hypothetical protein
VVGTRNDVPRSTACWELNSWEVGTHFIGSIATIRGVAVSELTNVVLAPALHIKVVEKRTRVSTANSNLARGSP